MISTKQLLSIIFILGLISTSTSQWLETTFGLPEAGAGLVAWNATSRDMFLAGRTGTWIAALDGASGRLRAMVPTDASIRCLLAVSTYNKVYCGVTGKLVMIDGRNYQTTRTVQLGTPYSLAYSSASGRVYFALSGLSRIGAIDATTDSLAPSIATPSPPTLLCPSSDGSKLYCWLQEADQLLIVDAGPDTVLASVLFDAAVSAMTFSDAVGRLYVADSAGDCVLVVCGSGDSLCGRISTGATPVALCGSPGESRVYCADRDSNTLTVIDTEGDSVLTSIPVGESPISLGHDFSRDAVYCVSYDDAFMRIIDTESNQVVGEVHIASGCLAVGVNPTDGRLFVPRGGSQAVSIVDSDSLRVTGIIALTSWPGSVCHNSINNKVYSSGWDDWAGSGYAYPLAISDANHLVAIGAVDGGRNPVCLAHNSDRNKLYCASRSEGLLRVYDGNSDSLLTTVAVGSNPTSVSYIPPERSAYCSSEAGLVVVDGQSDSVEATIRTGRTPADLAYSAENRRLYATDRGSSVYIIDASTNEIIRTLHIDWYPSTLCFNPVKNELYCFRLGDINGQYRDLFVIDCVGDSVAHVLPGTEASIMSCNWKENKVYCAGDREVTILSGETHEVLGEVPLGAAPTGAYYNSKSNKTYWTTDRGDVVVIDGVSDSAVATISVGVRLEGMAWDSISNRTYVGMQSSGAIAVIGDSLPTHLQENVDARPTTERVPMEQSIITTANGLHCSERAQLIDESGRVAMCLDAGQNRLSSVDCGVYFIRYRSGGPTRRVVIAR